MRASVYNMYFCVCIWKYLCARVCVHRTPVVVVRNGWRRNPYRKNTTSRRRSVGFWKLFVFFFFARARDGSHRTSVAMDAQTLVSDSHLRTGVWISATRGSFLAWNSRKSVTVLRTKNDLYLFIYCFLYFCESVRLERNSTGYWNDAPNKSTNVPPDLVALAISN